MCVRSVLNLRREKWQEWMPRREQGSNGSDKMSLLRRFHETANSIYRHLVNAYARRRSRGSETKRSETTSEALPSSAGLHDNYLVSHHHIDTVKHDIDNYDFHYDFHYDPGDNYIAPEYRPSSRPVGWWSCLLEAICKGGRRWMG